MKKREVGFFADDLSDEKKTEVRKRRSSKN